MELRPVRECKWPHCLPSSSLQMPCLPFAGDTRRDPQRALKQALPTSFAPLNPLLYKELQAVLNWREVHLLGKYTQLVVRLPCMLFPSTGINYCSTAYRFRLRASHCQRYQGSMNPLEVCYRISPTSTRSNSLERRTLRYCSQMNEKEAFRVTAFCNLAEGMVSRI